MQSVTTRLRDAVQWCKDNWRTVTFVVAVILAVVFGYREENARSAEQAHGRLIAAQNLNLQRQNEALKAETTRAVVNECVSTLYSRHVISGIVDIISTGTRAQEPGVAFFVNQSHSLLDANPVCANAEQRVGHPITFTPPPAPTGG